MELGLDVDLVHLQLEEIGKRGVLEERLGELPALLALQLVLEGELALQLEQTLVLDVLLQVIQLGVNFLTLLDSN